MKSEEPAQKGRAGSQTPGSQVILDFLKNQNADGVAQTAGELVPAQADLFVVMQTTNDWAINNDVSIIEFPVFSPVKHADIKTRTYSRAGKILRVIPSSLGAATLFDKDLLIYCVGQIVQANNAGMKAGRRLKLRSHPLPVSTRRGVGCMAYEGIVDMCRRLRGTTIETNIMTNEQEQIEGFGLIGGYKVTRYIRNGKSILDLEMEISNGFYRSAIESGIFPMHPRQFSLTQSWRMGLSAFC